jgi:1,4-dihydroxy-2-naphthoyl-CoA synthase
MGLVNKVVPAAEQAEVEAWCRELNAMSPTALKIAKQSFNADTDQLHGTTELGFTAVELYYAAPRARKDATRHREAAADFARFRR